MDDSTRRRAPDPRLAEQLAAQGGVRLSAATMEQILGHVAERACGAIRGCEHVGVSLVRGDRATTSAATDPDVLAVDLAQYELGEGPCLDSAREQRVFLVHDLDRETRWPRFAERARQIGVRSSLSVPIAVEGEPLGAMNLYASRERAFDEDEEVAFGVALAESAGILLDNAQSRAEAISLARQLEEAMRSRATIEQAKGILIGRHGYTPDEAFDALRQLSQHTNRKLRDVAADVVARSIAHH